MPKADPSPGLQVAIVGATGMVGAELLAVLEKRKFPIGRLFPFSSGRSRKNVRFHNRSLPAPLVDTELLSRCDLVFFMGADEVSRARARKLAASGVWVIDDSAAFRMDPDVPLVIPEVNAGDLSRPGG